ncbi:hydrolase [Sorangium cellulosum]|uniref:Hydrolase n=1 Tax=Sorangium cellulosum TaxID=56 RepID=A0A2L0F7B7_SORCE|nr:HAD family hydrolase [Sorangium cellulosum]AUX47417.1 hydrolase [Sorangium cellulosum]
MSSHVPARRRAALFDMDRTLLRKETASLYVKHQREIGEATTRDLLQALYWVGQYTLGILDAEKAAARVLLALRGMPETVLAARCDDWFRRCVEPHITDAGRTAVRRHRAAGDLCAIVTGAFLYVSRPLARRLGIEHVVSTVLEVDEHGRFTGRAEPPLCLGAGKLARARALADAQGFRLEDATFYTDSISDLPLLEIVAEPVAVNPDPRLRRVAERRGYRIERW